MGLLDKLRGRTNPYDGERGDDLDFAELEPITPPGWSYPIADVACYDTSEPGLGRHYWVLLAVDDTDGSHDLVLTMIELNDHPFDPRGGICLTDDYRGWLPDAPRIPWTWLPEPCQQAVLAVAVEMHEAIDEATQAIADGET